MRRYTLSTTYMIVTALCAVSSGASAQNYMPANRYEGPTIVVNMDVLGRTASAPMPMMIQDLPSPSAQGQKPLSLTPPSQAPIQEVARQEVREAVSAPTSVMTPQPFSAGAMAASAPPIPQQAPKAEAKSNDYAEAEVSDDEMIVAAPPPAPPLAELDAPSSENASENDNPARQLLARAREEAQLDDAHEEAAVTWDMASAEAAAPVVAPVAAPAPSAQTSLRVDDMDAFRVVFDANAQELKASEQAVLDTMIAQLQSDPKARLQIRAYAQGTPDTAAQARRLSLARALAVRSYVLAKGVPAPRLDVRALGIGSAAMGDLTGRSDVPSDRADLVLVR